MKISSRAELPTVVFSKALSVVPDSDLLNKRKPSRRKVKNPSFSGHGVRLRRDGAPSGRRSRPETPLLTWKYDDREKDASAKEEDDDKEVKKLPECRRKIRQKVRRRPEVTVSARKLAAGLWRLRPPEIYPDGGGRGKSGDRLGFQSSLSNMGMLAYHHNSRAYNSEAKDLIRSSHSLSGPKNGFLYKLEPSLQIPNSAMEGATKWDPVCSKSTDEVPRFYSHIKLLDQQVGAVSVISALESELEQAHARIQELETERRLSKKKFEHFVRKLSEERASWRSREHEKIRAVIDDVKADLSRERKNRQRIELVNSKLVSELADVKLSAKRFVQDYEKERKARELIEEVCDELAKEIGEDKAEIEGLKRESMKLREEVEEERKMLQMAEVWREERVQMKLVDVKVAVDEKYTQMNKLVEALKNFLRSRNASPDGKEMREAELLLRAAASVNVKDIREFAYEPPNPDDIFAVFEDVNCGEHNEREIETCAAHSPASHDSKIHTVSPEVNVLNNNSSQRHSKAFMHQNGDIEEEEDEEEEEEEEEEESGWETVSHPEDRGSSYSPDGSDLSANKVRRISNVSRSGTEWEENVGEETPVTEISEVCSVPTRQLKKSSISRFWKSCPNNGDYKIITVEGVKGRLSNGRSSNGSIVSPDRGSDKGGLSPSDFMGRWSSPDSANPHVNRVMKGCIEWPRNMQKSSLKSKLLEARMESQKIQLRQVLKQKI
ncbi:uncharacterized protein At5g41620-like [Malania oleifera]|uniref:uncharacterized protein At5g41620-like n=1 Tax=Malania oleifera TaxID=397392 RepID=UPI0025AE9D67|nr:uncharacterized protein At5g41620-like [Malania oleifera]